MKDPLEELEDKAAELRAIVVPEDGAPLDESWAQGVTQGVKLVPVVGKPLSLFLVSLPLSRYSSRLIFSALVHCECEGQCHQLRLQVPTCL